MSVRVRINRYLASAGFGSRRKCEEFIRQGLVTVNGNILAKLAAVVDPAIDVIAVNGRSVERPAATRVLVLNKPTGVLSTVSDSFNRKTVIDIVRENGIAERIFPVGRLDFDTSGILILTNDGDLAYRLTHPRFKIEKTYLLTVEGDVAEGTVAKISKGVELAGYKTRPCEVTILERRGSTTALRIRLTEGRKRQIRRMFALFGHRTVSLARVALGDLLFEDVAPGVIRPLTESEERRLRALAGLIREEGDCSTCR
jgi:23S rRNA pseudouridine2605 synthase